MNEKIPEGRKRVDSQLFPQPWQPPEYIEVRLGNSTENVCDRCGSWVYDQIRHNRHHRGIDQVKDGLVALTAIIVPGLPSQTLLASIGTAADVAAMISAVAGTPIVAQGGAGQPSKFGGEGGKGGTASNMLLTGGRGGGGNDPDIPECPRCGAFGGGGHGGGCRNSDKPVSEWT